MWDVVIVGARCAGAATALLLARQGRRVLMVDKSDFPSDTMSTLYIHQPGVARLDQWGILDEIVASGCPGIEAVTHQVNDVRLHGPTAAVGGVKVTYAPRRAILDRILIDAAVDAGVEFEPRCSLLDLITESGNVVGAQLRTQAGKLIDVRAHLVVGADGMNSRLAQLAEAELVVQNPRLSCVYYTGWTGLSCGFAMRERTGSWVATVPTHDGVTLVLTYFPQERFASIKSEPLEAHLDSIRSMDLALYEEVRAGDQAINLIGTGSQLNFFRRAFGDGWVLVGDAGHHLDSITARGITNAFVQADALSAELSGADMADRQQIRSALSRFVARRDAELTEGYYSTLETAKLTVQPSRERLLSAISQVPELTERYFAMAAGVISMNAFLTPDLIEIIRA
jgi:flavin-dependent dehydrogenase